MAKSLQFYTDNQEKAYPRPYYPIGALFLSVNDTDPSTWFGGVWELVGKGCTLIGVDPNDPDFNIPMKTGGSKKHKHLQTFGSNPTAIFAEVQTTEEVVHSGNKLVVANADGYVESHPSIILSNTYEASNVPPHFTCYFWLRVS